MILLIDIRSVTVQKPDEQVHTKLLTRQLENHARITTHPVPRIFSYDRLLQAVRRFWTFDAAIAHPTRKTFASTPWWWRRGGRCRKIQHTVTPTLRYAGYSWFHLLTFFEQDRYDKTSKYRSVRDDTSKKVVDLGSAHHKVEAVVVKLPLFVWEIFCYLKSPDTEKN